ncbi:Rx, N-terminal, partial [Dillenia turbinata]
MGEPLLAAHLQTLLDNLGPLLNFAHLKEFRSELRTWRSKLLQVRRVLCDAEDKQVSDREVKKWLDTLRDLAYTADDVLDELRHEALQRQNNTSSSDSAASSSQVQDLLAQIQEITTRILDIEEDKSDLGLKERPGVRSSIINNRLPTTSLLDSSPVVGREKDIDAILKLLDIGGTTKAEENRNRRLRTLLAHPTQKMNYSYVRNYLLHDLLPQLRYLRVLSLNSLRIDVLSSSAGDLKHLRYLNLSYACFEFLPESLCYLYFLQSLILRGCAALLQLPLRLKDLANLRYLDISHTTSLIELPPHVLDLKFFRKLTKFVVGKTLGSWGTKKVHTLPGGLEISMLDAVKDVEDALVINLMNKKNIEELKFEWGRHLYNTKNAENQVQIINLLVEPCKMLRNLEINGYSGVTLPNWISDFSHSKLVELSLINCERCKSLPSLGQLPLLQKLIIEGMLEIETIEAELYGEASLHGQPFPSLIELCIVNCKNLRTLPDVIMSSNGNLQVLEIRACESLESFPSGVLPSTLKKLSIWDCRKLESISEMLLSPTSLDHIDFF